MATSAPRVRRAVEGDVPALLTLMRNLAKFEGYDAEFAVTEDLVGTHEQVDGFARLDRRGNHRHGSYRRSCFDGRVNLQKASRR